MGTRDVRTELHDRLDAAYRKKRTTDDDYVRQKAALKARFRKKAALIESEIAAIRSLLDIEDARLDDVREVESSPRASQQGPAHDTQEELLQGED